MGRVMASPQVGADSRVEPSRVEPIGHGGLQQCAHGHGGEIELGQLGDSSILDELDALRGAYGARAFGAQSWAQVSSA